MKRVDRFFGLLALTALLLTTGNGCGSKDNGKSKVLDSNRYTALGEVMAAKTAELCGGQGDIVLLVNDQDTADTAFGMTVAAFRRALNPAIHITATEALKLLPPMPGLEPFSPSAFLEVLRKHSHAGALVSFVGVPQLTAEQLAQLPSPRPKVVEAVAFNPPTRAMFAQQVVWLAAVAKPVNGADAKPQSTQEWFDACYQLITTETAGTLP